MDLALSEMVARLGEWVHWPLPLVLWPIPIGVPFWLIFFWARAGEQQIHSRERVVNDSAKEFDKGSWALINYGWRLVRLGAVVIALITPAWGDAETRDALYCTGLLLMVAGALLRQHCFRMLGDRFTYTVRAAATNAIVKRGIYRWVRHPSYTGGMLYNLGIGLALTNWRSAVLVIVGMVVMYVYRVRVEESALLEVHNGDYAEYMRGTKRFVPFVF